MIVVKRDGQRVDFDMQRIKNAILKAAAACDREIPDVRLSGICGSIKGKLEYQEQVGALNEISVEAIQDIVESELMSFDDLTDIAKAYILYRNQRTQIREVNSNLMKTLHGIFSVSREDNDMKRENANINTDAPMGVMLKVGSETSKEYALNYLMKPAYAKAHREGDMHIHDLDFYATTETCVQIPLGKLLARGFTTGHGYLRPPKNINSASALTCIAIQSSQNDMHGGQAVPCFDYDLAPYVALTFVSDIVSTVTNYVMINTDGENVVAGLESYAVMKPEKVIAKFEKVFKKKVDNHYDVHGSIMDEGSADTVIDLISTCFELSKTIAQRIYKQALKITDGRTYQAMEALVHNLNTMNSRAGSQVPFSSINLGTCTQEEGRIVIRNLLYAMDAGLGHHETSFFPVVIFRMKAGVNFNKGDKNYDLFKLAMKVSAKRLFPCFSNVDAPFNAQYYKEGRPETEIAYMGCVDGTQLVTYKMGDTVCIDNIATMYAQYVNDMRAFVTEGRPMRNWFIFDGQNGWVALKDVICNSPEVSARIGWRELLLSNGQVIKATSDHPFVVKRDNVNENIRVRDMHVGDKIVTSDMADSFAQLNSGVVMDVDTGYALGALVAKGFKNTDGSLEIKCTEKVVVDTNRIGRVLPIKCVTKNSIAFTAEAVSAFEEKTGIPKEVYISLDGGFNMNSVPMAVISAPKATRLAFIEGFCAMSGAKVKFDEFGKIFGTFRCLNKGKLPLTLQLLFRSLGSELWYDSAKVDANAKMIVNCCFTYTEDIGAVTKPIHPETGNPFDVSAYKVVEHPETLDVVSIRPLYSNNIECSYDVTTETGTFDVSGLRSHNCRTRVIGNVYDPEREITVGRGNLSFTSINLPRLGILANHDISKFYELLDNMMETAVGQLLERFEIQRSKHVFNYPMLMGQGEWIDSDNLSQNDSVAEVLKHGSLSVGFIGLAECLVALIGKHHGESEEAQKLGLEIIKHMRDYLDRVSEAMKLNFGLLGTPAEGLSGRFVRIDKQRFGIIKGVTDKDYYTNSTHVPVGYPITAFEKLKIEAPYHAYENAGHIAYVELDGDPSKNLAAFEQIVRYMHDVGIGYGSINHIVDMDPVCGYIGIIGDECPRCHRKEGEAMTVEMYNQIKGYTQHSSNLAFLGDMNEGLQSLSDFKE